MGSRHNFGRNPGRKGSGDQDNLFAQAEQYIIDTITDQGAGPQNLSDGGLRFVRYLLSISRPAKFGFLPNFASLDALREVAGHFIRYSGGTAPALATMNQVLDGRE